MNTKTITAALVAFTMLVMATSPLLNNTNELQPNAIVEFGHGGDIDNGTAILSGTLTWQDNAWNATWTCNGGLALVTPSDWNNFIASGEYDPHNFTSWSIGLTGAGSYYTENAPEGEWVVTAGLGCEDDTGVLRAAGGQFGDVHENPPTVNLTNGTTVADVSFTLIENGGEGSPSLQQLMDMLDTDGDGVLSLDEIIDGINGFNDEDGVPPLSEEEEGYIEIAFNESDYDGNGTLDLDELGFFFDLMEDDGDITFVCGDGSEIPFNSVNDGYGDCADGADEQQYDVNGTEINWFDCQDGSEVWIHQVNDGTEDCPDGEDEGEDDSEDFEPECLPLSMNMQLNYDGAGGIYFEIDNACAFSATDSSAMRDMFDMYIGNGDGVLNESEADSAIDMMMDGGEEDNSSEEDGNWTIDGVLVEMTETGIYTGLANPSIPISMSMTMTTDSIPWDGTSGSHTVMFVENSDYVDDNPDDECIIGQVVSNSDFEPTSIVLTPATQFTITDDGSGNWDVEEIPDSATGECDSKPETATMVFDSVGGPVDTEPSCAYTWTVATDTSWETETGITLGPDGDETITFEPGSYMIAVQCTDAENDVVNAAWSNADGTLSASETGSGTVFGWVQFTIPDGVTGTMDVDYEWDSTTFGSNGTFTFNFASNDTADPDDEIVGTGGGLPGFTSILAITALLGAAMIFPRRKD